MTTAINPACFRHWPISVGLLGLACLFSGAGLAQRPSIAGLQSQIANLQANNVAGLASYLAVDTSTPTRPVLRVTAANFQVVNGLGGTSTVNGVGNVIVGYDETNAALPAVCSLGQYIDQPTCVAGGGTWAVAHKTGSHNIVVGPNHRYSVAGGFIAGTDNTVNGNNSAVSGGARNTASGTDASVSGGFNNTSSGIYASISGGSTNTATVNHASVSGGDLNTASGFGGNVSGGTGNTASGSSSTVSGGRTNTALGAFASVSGGFTHSAPLQYNWAAGTLSQSQ